VDVVFLSLPQVVERYAASGYAGVGSRWTIYEMTRSGAIPHRKLAGRRELLFPLVEPEGFENGAELETVRLPNGGPAARNRDRGRGVPD
jgi:hypothetical protein